ncbi:hypothetical protein [Sphaerisporangium sp. TRM90804]|uniref:hypothetical protein n=1 Tax=Sphaerisporangium sp. TRM90804 TaxID=3031113 RepID=UPI00244CA2C7|nr:hypothetical protein [Sphaerisporangium sp. TRM90804]MDH2429824.1 hypothetical protein [Sphaerisporangium sp. TRM90804]
MRVQRESPLAYAELARVTSAAGTGLSLRGTPESGEVVARHGDAEYAVAVWQGRLYGKPASDWEVAHLARLAGALGAGLVGEDGETYGVRDGVLEQAGGASPYEFGKVDDIIATGPARWDT